MEITKQTVNGLSDDVYWGAEDRLGIEVRSTGIGFGGEGNESIAEIEFARSHQEGVTVKETVMQAGEAYDLSCEDFAFASDEETTITCIVTVYSRSSEGEPRVFESRATTTWRKAGVPIPGESEEITF